jgi:hypothetical protein
MKQRKAQVSNGPNIPVPISSTTIKKNQFERNKVTTLKSQTVQAVDA